MKPTLQLAILLVVLPHVCLGGGEHPERKQSNFYAKRSAPDGYNYEDEDINEAKSNYHRGGGCTTGRGDGCSGGCLRSGGGCTSGLGTRDDGESDNESIVGEESESKDSSIVTSNDESKEKMLMDGDFIDVLVGTSKNGIGNDEIVIPNEVITADEDVEKQPLIEEESELDEGSVVDNDKNNKKKQKKKSKSSKRRARRRAKASKKRSKHRRRRGRALSNSS